MVGRAAASAWACACALVIAACGLRVSGELEPGAGGGATSDGTSSGSSGTPSSSDGPETGAGTSVDVPNDSGTTTPVDAAKDATFDSAGCTADLSTSLQHCGACFAACPIGSTKCQGGECLATLRIRV